ncbi:MAG: hypothetical protein JSS89_10340 [Bacteroidetes bacterium]|nr:hypothetical protein [Bacteroidota bacterium]
MSTQHGSLWVVGADMGYGHQRAVWPFRDIAHNGIIAAGDNEHASLSERKLWRRYLSLYEAFSRAKSIPLIGKRIFAILDRILHIPSLYPIRNLSHTTFEVDQLHRQLDRGLGDGVMNAIRQAHLPLLTSFYVPAIKADLHGHESVYSIICDADLHRVWVAREPWESRINYFAPCGKAAQRLRSYGVPPERIFLTGFPLDEALLGGRDLSTLRRDLAVRLRVLDPTNRFHTLHGASVEHFMEEYANTPVPADRVLTITYAVGGAGALKEIGTRLMKAFRHRLLDGTMRLNLVAGTRAEVAEYFLEGRREIVADADTVRVLHANDLATYFAQFNEAIRTTDILWTKPSELSFYVGLGLPIIMTSTIGSQERYNRKWLLEIGAGMRQEKVDYADHWLFDQLDNGRFAELAWMGFLRARKLGTYHIQDVIRTGSFTRSDSPLLR